MKHRQAKILKQYPNADPLVDFTVIDDEIVHWDVAAIGAPKPTDAELDQHELSVVMENKLNELATNTIEALESDFHPGVGRDEILQKLVVAVGAIFDHLGWTLDPQLQPVRVVTSKARNKQAEIKRIAAEVSSGTKTSAQAVTEVQNLNVSPTELRAP